MPRTASSEERVNRIVLWPVRPPRTIECNDNNLMSNTYSETAGKQFAANFVEGRALLCERPILPWHQGRMLKLPATMFKCPKGRTECWLGPEDSVRRILSDGYCQIPGQVQAGSRPSCGGTSGKDSGTISRESPNGSQLGGVREFDHGFPRTPHWRVARTSCHYYVLDDLSTTV